ncbi:chorismate mutase [Methanocaldococcus infernus]|uniref:Chorismate mutase, type II n=1 Tax=Methanocaldococcus infernus (strain DSM 11812 / JCM 15783 / ME) TaxID=573063 RepID=D5VSK4_METIM|nr:chorismate mutase [Methanocaldococcus infernus]ADG13557.1 Chorismate mutase, type II [Methanocaldococcus infernus ME]
MEHKELKDIRKRIDEIDKKILELVAERNRLAKNVAEIKVKNNIPIDDKEREKYIYERIKNLCNHYNIDPNFGLKLFKLLIEHNKELQRKYIETLKK